MTPTITVTAAKVRAPTDTDPTPAMIEAGAKAAWLELDAPWWRPVMATASAMMETINVLRQERDQARKEAWELAIKCSNLATQRDLLRAHADRLAAALDWFVSQKDSFDEMNGDQSDAYYHFIKHDKQWIETMRRGNFIVLILFTIVVPCFSFLFGLILGSTDGACK